MAQPNPSSKEALIARIQASREQLSAHSRDLKARLDPRTRLRSSLVSHPIAWFAGSLGTGWLFSRLFRKPKPATNPARHPKPKRSWIGLLVGGTFTLARPAIQNWLLREASRRFPNALATLGKYDRRD